jgi:hypothetical protein
MADILVHVVLTNFYPHVPQQTREAMREKMAALGTACGGSGAGILYWRADWNLDRRKNYHLMEFGIFADEAALECFRAHPAHVAFGNEMRRIADWVVGDIKAALPAL